MRILKLFIALIFVVPLLLVAAVYGIANSVNLADYRDNIQTYIAEKTGFDVVFEGEMDLRILPHPTLSVETLRVNAFRGEEPLFIAHNVHVETTLKDYLSMGVGFKRIAMDQPKVYLYKDYKQRANWEKVRSKRKSSNSLDLSFIKQIGQISIADASVVYENDAFGQQYALEQAHVAIEGKSLDYVNVNLSTLFNGKFIELESQVDLANTEKGTFKAVINSGDNIVSLDGLLSHALSQPLFEGALTVEGETIFNDIYDVLRFSPEQRGFNQPIRLNTAAKLAAGDISLSDLSLFIGQDEQGLKTQGQFSAKLKDKIQHIEGVFNFNEPLDLSVIGICTQQKDGDKENKAYEWSEDRMDFSLLDSFVSDLILNASQGISCNDLSVESLNAHIRTQKGSLKLESLEIKQGEGSLAAKASLTGTRSYKGEVDIQLDQLPITQIIGGDLVKRLDMPLSGHVEKTFAGATEKQWISSLAGSIDVSSSEMGTAGLEGGSLVSVMRYLVGQNKVAPAGTFQEGSFNLQANTKKGVMRVQDVHLTMPSLSIVGEGKVDINRMAINLRVMPTASELLDLSLPVLVKGSLMKPVIVPDPSSVRNQATAVGAAIGGPVGAAVGSVIGGVIAGEGDSSKNEKKEEVDPSKERLLKFLQNQLEQ